METNRRCVECVDQVLEFVADKKITMSSCVLHRHGDVGHRIEPSESFMASAPLRRRLAGAPDMNKRCDLLVAPPPSSASLATHSSAGPSTPPAAPRRRLPARSLPSAAPFASLPSKSTIQGRGPGRILSDAVLRSKASPSYNQTARNQILHGSIGATDLATWLMFPAPGPIPLSKI
ncbi:hypothetical protein B296_00049513 [Ensete ventricosum]|uniref:Uncharacterized protein n=1 Tax=Ensete ventricosum TaxID=4639 RepID=A0A426XBL0_ENSVE|nr:hypothetical protein B296_00049513 [Ensete ventricosum]